jgi:hypothetical protein
MFLTLAGVAIDIMRDVDGVTDFSLSKWALHFPDGQLRKIARDQVLAPIGRHIPIGVRNGHPGFMAFSPIMEADESPDR